MELPKVLEEKMAVRDVEMIFKFGHWLQAMAKGDIEAVSIKQIQFISVSKGGRASQSEHEKAWTSLMAAKRLSG